ncbi:MAG TPA: 30S ribosomal protein S13 [Candidatus Nanoarchaeia archaeon]|nr:30S ribosomal protein S13 [Candidatus Nanoarchaeia archaeon]
MAEFQHIVRVVNTDLKGEKQIGSALRRIKGVGFMYANMACFLAGIDQRKRAGDLSEEEVKKIDDVLRNPLKHQAPVWMLNRRRDYESNENKHILATDIKFVLENDIKRLKKIRSYRGIRHAYGLPVRGQRTRSNFRRNKGKVMGVQRSKAAAPAAAAPDKKGEQKEKGKK